MKHNTMMVLIACISLHFVRQNGDCSRWGRSRSSQIRNLTCDVNAPLLKFLVEYIDCHDTACIDFFRWGAPLFDEGAEKQFNNAAVSNRELLERVRCDENEEALHQIAFDDWEKGRMTKPRKAKDMKTEMARLCH